MAGPGTDQDNGNCFITDLINNVQEDGEITTAAQSYLGKCLSKVKAF